MKPPKPVHSLIMVDSVGSRSFSTVEGTVSHARDVASLIATSMDFRVRLETAEGNIEVFEPAPEPRP